MLKFATVCMPSRHCLHNKKVMEEHYGYIHNCANFTNPDKEGIRLRKEGKDEQAMNKKLISDADERWLPYTQIVVQWKALKEPLYAWGNLSDQDTLKQAVFDPKDLVMYSYTVHPGSSTQASEHGGRRI